MNGNYYLSFFVRSASGDIGFQYDGQVELNEAVFDATLTRDEALIARLVAQSLEVPEATVHVLEWHPLH